MMMNNLNQNEKNLTSNEDNFYFFPNIGNETLNLNSLQGTLNEMDIHQIVINSCIQPTSKNHDQTRNNNNNNNTDSLEDFLDEHEWNYLFDIDPNQKQEQEHDKNTLPIYHHPHHTHQTPNTKFVLSDSDHSNECSPKQVASVLFSQNLAEQKEEEKKKRGSNKEEEVVGVEAMSPEFIPLSYFFVCPKVKTNLHALLKLPPPLLEQVPAKSIPQMCIKGMQQAYSFARRLGNVTEYEREHDKRAEWTTLLFGHQVRVRMSYDALASQYYIANDEDIQVVKESVAVPLLEPFHFHVSAPIKFDKGFKAHDFGVWDMHKEFEEIEFVRFMVQHKCYDQSSVRFLPYYFYDHPKRSMRSEIDVIILLYESYFCRETNTMQPKRTRAMFTRLENGETCIKHYYNLNKAKKLVKNLTSVYAAASYALFSGQNIIPV